MQCFKTLMAPLTILVMCFLATPAIHAQTFPYFAWGKNAEYTPATGDYEMTGIGFPVGFHQILGNVVPVGEFFPADGVFFEGTFSGTQTVMTFFGDIEMTLSGDVLLEIDETGMAFGTWNPVFEITDGSGIYSNASGCLAGVAINPPFDPSSEVWGFNWAIWGVIDMGWDD